MEGRITFFFQEPLVIAQDFSYPLSCWAGNPETPKRVQATTIALGCLPELDDKTLFLKTLHTLGKGCGKSRENGSRNFLPASFHRAQSCWCPGNIEKSLILLFIQEHCEIQ